MPHHSNRQRKRNDPGRVSSSRKKKIKAIQAEERMQAHFDRQLALKDLERDYISEAAEINWMTRSSVCSHSSQDDGLANGRV